MPIFTLESLAALRRGIALSLSLGHTGVPEPRPPETPKPAPRRWVSVVVAVAIMLLLPMLLAASADSSTPRLVLVRDAQPNAVIVWWTRSSSPTPRFAAGELARYVARSSGGSLPVYEGRLGRGSGTDRASSGLVIATGAAAARFSHSRVIPARWVARGAARLTGSGDDEFTIATIGANRLVLSGASQRGTLYAAYELLEHLGVRFFAPRFGYYRGTAERVPRRTTVATVPIAAHERASLSYRRLYVEEGWSHNAANLAQLIDWMAKARLNVLVYPYDYRNVGVTQYDTYRGVVAAELAKRGLVAEVGGHGFTSWLPPDQYPEYYVPRYNVFDITNPAAVQQYVSNVVAYLRTRPEIQIFDAWPPDGARTPPKVITAYGSLVNAQAYLIRQLTDAVRAELPGVRIEEIAYVPATQPPEPQYMYDATANVIDIAPWDRSYRVPIYDHSAARNAYYDDLIRQWRGAFGGDLAIYEYYRKYVWHSLPCTMLNLIGDEIPYYRSLGTDGLGKYSEPADWLAYEPTHALVAAMSWNSSLTADEWVNGYLADRFGSAAAPMATYFANVESACRTIYTSPAGEYGDLGAVTHARSEFRDARDALTSAATAVPPRSSAALIVQRLTRSIEFAIADTEISYQRLTGDTVAREQAEQRTRELVTEHRFDGIVLHNSYTAGRYRTTAARADIAAMYRSPAFGFVRPDRDLALAPGSSSGVEIAAQSVDYQPHTVQWSAAPPAGISVAPDGGAIAVTASGIVTRRVTVSAASDVGEGGYQIPVSFSTEDGTTLPQAVVNVVVAGRGSSGP